MPTVGTGLVDPVVDAPDVPDAVAAPPSAPPDVLVAPVAGPPGPHGAPGAPGPPGEINSLEIVQALPIGTGQFLHNLGRRAAVTLRDLTSYRVFDADVTEEIVGQVVVTFVQPTAFSITLS